MGEVKTLVTLVLGGMFDHNELGDIDIIYEPPAAEALQQELVTGVDDVHVELVSRLDYDALMQRNFELLAQLECARGDLKTAMEIAEKNRVDAERYRHIREHSYVEVRCDSPRKSGWKPELLDICVDSAIEKERT